jgi:hypothetical protein
VVEKHLQKACIHITYLLLDGQFEYLWIVIIDMYITLNTVSNDDHVPEVERYTFTRKEYTRSIFNALPFSHIPEQLLIEMVYSSNFWLNSFLPDGQWIEPRLCKTLPI